MFKTIHDCAVTMVSYSINNTGHEADLESMDFAPVSAARVSFAKEHATGTDKERDIKLLNYLAEHEHLTPFEYQHATFLIECPLFIRSQIHRHRTFSYNEISRRYTSENLEFWIPDKWRKQSKSNKQASTDEYVQQYDVVESLGWEKDENDIPRRQGTRNNVDPFIKWKYQCYNAWHCYEDYLESGVCREQARAVLPQSLLTRFYMGGVLRNWVHFIRLRKDSHAQYEVRVIAEKIERELRKLWPMSMKALLS